MKFNSPLPQPLPKECAKAAKIFKSFVDSGNNGLDGVIPRSVLENAKGFAIFTIFKAGFLFSARAGSGIVIARLDDGTWSAPSAIGTAGLGVGGQAGAEMTDFLVVLNSRSAIRSFMAAGSLTLGGNMSVALGPLGRNGEATGSLSTTGKVAAMYSYSKTRGLFGGVSVEGSVIVERQDANVIAYGSDNVTAKKLLGGAIEPLPWAQPLIKTLEACTGFPGTRQWIDDRPEDSGYAFGGVSPETTGVTSQSKKKKASRPSFPPAHWGSNKDSGSFFDPVDEPQQRPSAPRFETHFESDFVPDEQPKRDRLSFSPIQRQSSEDPYQTSSSAADIGRNPPYSSSHSRSKSTPLAHGNSTYDFSSNRRSSYSSSNPFGRRSNSPDDFLTHSPASGRSPGSDRAAPYIAPKPELTRPLLPHEGVARAVALYNFAAVESGDLSFSKGDVLTITQMSESTDDWWTGKANGKQGIFPANFVEVV